MSYAHWNLIYVLFLVTAGAAAQSLPESPGSSARIVASKSSYQPITASQRLSWFALSTVGPEGLAAGVFSAGLGTARDRPVEYGPSWSGFGKRYGMRLTGVATSNAMEASLGTLWGEDPRYVRAAEGSFKERVGNVALMTFAARRRDGTLVPAYARYVATSGNNFLSNAWRADSEATSHAAAVRTIWGFVGRMGNSAFAEFWPDVKTRLFHKKH